MISWLLIVGFIILAGLSWWNQRIGLWLIFLILPTYLLQFEIFSIPTTVLEVSVYILALIFAVRNCRKLWSFIKQALQPIWLPLVLLLIGLVIGIIVTPDTRLALGIFKGWFIDPVILYVLVVSLIDWRKIQHYIFALVLSILPIGAMALWQVFTNNFITVDGRASAWFVSGNYLSMYLVPIMLLSLILITGKYQVYKWIASVVLIISLMALFFSYSYGGWVALIAGLIVLGILYSIKSWKLWIGGVVVLIVAVLTQFENEKFVRMLDWGEKSSLSVRFQVWQTSLLMIKENWLTGIGLGQFRDQYLDFASRLFAPPLELAILHAHNLYFQFWINTGIVGLVGLVWLVVRFFTWFKNNFNLQATILLSTMVAILAHGLLDTTYWKNDLSALFWIVIAFAVLKSNHKLRV